jgi:hypothetical protein
VCSAGRTRPGVWTRLGVTLLAVAVLPACVHDRSRAAGPTTPPATSAPPVSTTATDSTDAPDFSEPFDNNDNDWPTRSAGAGAALAVTGGGYRVALPAGSSRFIRPGALAQRSDVRGDVSVAGTVSVLAGQTYAVGLACRLNPVDGQYYLGRLSESGTSAIVRGERGRGERILRSTWISPSPLGAGRPVRLVVLCSETAGTLRVTVLVNGAVAIRADDPAPLPENPPGIFAAAGRRTPSSVFGWDDVRVSPPQTTGAPKR